MAAPTRLIDFDVATGTAESRVVPHLELLAFVGGSGLAPVLFLRRDGFAVEPLDPAAPLFVLNGALTGTRLPGAARFSVAGRSPLTGGWGEANCGGHFGPVLARQGVLGVALHGKAAQPSIVVLSGGKAELHPRPDLWGLDTYQTAARLKEEIPGAKVLAIGPAGERGSAYAALVHDRSDLAARMGLGSVLGAKNVKALVAADPPVGSRAKAQVYEPDAYARIRRDATERMMALAPVQSLRDLGTNGALETLSAMGDVPIRNWELDEWPEGSAAVSGTAMQRSILSGRKSCFSCPIGCRRLVRLPGQEEVVPGPEYETAAILGVNLMIPDVAWVAQANDLCNRLGLDTISIGGVLAFLTSCLERGLLQEEDVGLPLAFGRPEPYLEAIRQIAMVEGIGERLRRGAWVMARQISAEAAELLVQVRGLESPAHDPRAFHGVGLNYATSPVGASHSSGLNFWVEVGSVRHPALGLGGPFDRLTSVGKAEVTARAQDLAQVINASGLCIFTSNRFRAEELCEALSIALGATFGPAEFLAAGARMWLLKRGIAVRVGGGASEDRLPTLQGRPKRKGSTAGSAPDMGMMLPEFYRLRGLDADGYPTREAWSAAGLDEFAWLLDRED